ncbi:PD-(D/E)XK nuclease-like domain-containing protein [Mesoterricola silvestris]|uniref:Putative exodeoxyribonuclease 8 PDDEXK-like domain-containing protein n=1 Tax=Mesoterricola silvestris TaxID=2927979 RepID=A0AA48K8I6_9BACT|nr:PD-(D/E)XK nuclease-like domain-containing protein [Mesoterricola silvestris]BDU72336.1 hypothetical protein METEAL_15100 [Mesoterricola silvestris]
MILPNVPGINPNIPFADYLKLPGLSASALKKLMRSPLAFKWAKDHPDTGSTPALAMGTATHTAILEPERFKEDYVIWDGDKRGKDWLAFKEANANRSILSASEYENVEGMRNAIRNFGPAARYLQDGIAEVTIQWIDPETGRPMRGRVDWVTKINGQTVLSDLKTTRDSSPRKFGADAYKLGYHIQSALYCDGWYHLTGEFPRFVFLAVESKEPYEPAVFNTPEDVLAQGHEEYMRLQATLKECEDTNTWPPRAMEEQDLTLPAWAMDSEDEDLSDIGLDLTA